MPLASYWEIIRRRWWLIALIIAVDVLVSGYLYRKASTQAGSQACLTLYVADVSSPSTISAPPTTLETAGQLLAGETAANFFADDLKDIASSRSVAHYMTAYVRSRGGSFPPGADVGFEGTVGGSRVDRTVDLCVTKSNAAVARFGATALARAMTTDRARFIGKQMAKRTFVNVISAPEVSAAPTSHALLTFLLRVILGILVALGLAYLWDALDPAVHDATAAEAALTAP